MIEKNGNILYCQEKALIQQVNCMNKMGSGLAKAIYTKWSVVKREYHNVFIHIPNTILLGEVLVVDVGNKFVFNAFSQYKCGKDGKQYTDYDAVQTCFERTLMHMTDLNIDDLAVPYQYGCGLGGGNWDIVSEIIDGVLKDRAICYKF